MFSLDFSNFSFKRGFLSSEARLAPFSRLARVSEYPLSELGVLSVWRDKCLAKRANDALSADASQILLQILPIL